MALAIFWFADGAAGHSPDEYVEPDSGFADDAFGGSIKAASMVVSSPQARVILRNSIAGDRQAVEALFDATDGENWIDNSSWLSNRPLGAWFGITTNSKGRITAIELTDNQLEGQIPAEVGNLANLEHLDLAGNLLTGSIPEELGEINRLRHINLGQNLLEGTIPFEALARTSLETLILHENQLFGSLPTQIGKLGRLAHLDLHANAISGSIPAQLGSLRSLRFLNLGANQFSGTIPKNLGNLVKLQQLRAQQNRLSGEIPPQLGNLPFLRTLQLEENRLSGVIPPELGNLTRLHQLRLNRNGLTGPLPPELGNLTRLTVLLLQENRLSGSIPPQFGALTELDWFFVRDNRLSGCVPAKLRTVTHNDIAKTLDDCPFGLPGLEVAPGALDPPFDGTLRKYTLRVGIDVNFITLNPVTGPTTVTLRDPRGDLLIDADISRLGHQIVLTSSETLVELHVASDEGASEATYNLIIQQGFPAKLTVTGNEYFPAPGNLDLKHNIPDLEVVIDGETVRADFLSHFRRTGEIERWGYPTSEVLVLESNSLTQFYQRGVVDFHDVGSGWVVERRLAWDYVGGGEGGSPDLGVEEGIANPNPGNLIGPWGHKVSNLDIDGTVTGFAEFFEKLGGVSAFGLPKTDARVDTNADGTLHLQAYAPGVVRQYFQAAVLELHPYDLAAPVKLALLGDDLRGLLVPGFERERAFAAAEPLAIGEIYLSGVVAASTPESVSASDQGFALPPASALARIESTFESLRQTGSAMYELRGRWFGASCGSPSYSGATYMFGEIAGEFSALAYFDDGRERYWYVDRTYWTESDGIWTTIETSRFFNELGWQHVFSDPVRTLENIVGFAKAENFDVRALDGRTELTASEVAVPSGWFVRDIRFLIDDDTNAIREFGWTFRVDTGNCFKRVDARDGSYGVVLTLPVEIAQSRS